MKTFEVIFYMIVVIWPFLVCFEPISTLVLDSSYQAQSGN